ncbi:ABC transporter permease [Paraburkholderia xenovorans]|uniref:ABC transporter permease n=1 Tax=Paraburkholderia xenovorans TaxID=36873 RepID=UPI0038BDCAC3
MVRLVLNRLFAAVPTLLLSALAVFAMIRLIPGDPAAVMLGDQADPASLAELRHALGLDLSLPSQFLRWAGRALHGDLGVSIRTGEPVLALVIDRFEVSARLVVVAVSLAAAIAVPAGIVAAWRQNGKLDLATVGTATVLLSIPGFWLGLMLLYVFGLKLGWLPVVGYVSFAEDTRAALLYLVLPLATLVLNEIGIVVHMSRASALDVLRLEYITHARAKGLSEWAILRRHVFRNAFGPTWTLIGLMLGNLLGGIAVVETVFTIPGLGRLLVDSILSRDYPVVQGCLLVIVFAYLVINLVVDLLYPLFDPRMSAL